MFTLLMDNNKVIKEEELQKILFVEDTSIKPSRIIDRFESMEDIHKFVDKLNIKEVTEGTTNREIWNYVNEEHPDNLLIKNLFEGESNDDHLDIHGQISVDEYMDAIFEEKIGLTEERAIDTGVMHVVHQKVIDLVKTHSITDPNNIQIGLITK